MKTFEIQNTTNKVLISIDKTSVNKDFLLNFLENLRMEYLAEEIDFDETIEELGEEIKRNWWQENKERYLNGK